MIRSPIVTQIMQLQQAAVRQKLDESLKNMVPRTLESQGPGWDRNTIFARTCSLVERQLLTHGPDPLHIGRRMRTAPVVEFGSEDYRGALDCVKAEAAKIPDFVRVPPMMPFDEVLLLDEYGCCLIWDAVDYEYGEKKQESLTSDGSALQADVLRTFKFLYTTFSTPLSSSSFGGAAEYTWTICAGRAALSCGQNETHAGLQPAVIVHDGMYLAGIDARDEPLIQTDLTRLQTDYLKSPMIQNLYREIADALNVASSELYYIDLPRHHMIVETPRRTLRDALTSPKIPRLQDRDRVRLITPEHIKKVYPSYEARADQKRHIDATPRVRRGHTRYLVSAHYKTKRWHTIKIPPTWMGDVEWEQGPYRYRVITPRTDHHGS